MFIAARSSGSKEIEEEIGKRKHPPLPLAPGHYGSFLSTVLV